MHWDKSEKILNKLNSLFNVLKANGEEIKEIEKDLLKQYTSELYDSLIFSEKKSIPSIEKYEKEIETKFVETKVDNTRVERILEQKPAIDTTPVEKVLVSHAAVSGSDNVIDLVNGATEETASRNGNVQEVIKIEKEEPTIVIEEQIEETVTPQSFLFDEDEYNNNELVNRLSDSPIKDLNRAFSINDKISMMNRLFGGKEEEFSKAIFHLNTMNTFKDAQAYMLDNYVHQYDWEEESKLGIAKNFIGIVRRRFL